MSPQTRDRSGRRGALKASEHLRAELERMGRNGQAFYRRGMSMESGVPRFEALFRGVRATEYASVEP